MEKKRPPLLSFLSDELGYAILSCDQSFKYDIFYIDLSSWKLRLSERTPVIWVKRSDIGENSPRDVMQSLQDVIRERRLDRQTVLFLYDGDSQTLLRYAGSFLQDSVVIGENEQHKVLHSRRPSGELLDLISAQVPISNLAPYEKNTPVMGSRFFGREYELKRILSNTDTNYLILGIRRIGKTSLLKEVERVLADSHGVGKIIYQDCSDILATDDFVREVVRKLNPKELPRLEYKKYVFYFPDFLERMRRKYQGKIILILDEIDNLIFMQRGNWDLFRMLHVAANTGSCQFIIAGFREAMQEHYLLDSPFYKFAQEIRLNEFTRKQAQDLITIPMENLRIHVLNKDEVVGRIYQETAGHPNLIQYYCMIMLRRLEQTGKREIGPDSLIDVYSDEGFKSHLLTSFSQNTKNRDKAIVYAVLREADEGRLSGFSQPFMDAALRKRGIVLPQNEIDEACNVLTLGGILHRKGKDYSFTSPVFTKVLQYTYDLDYLLGKVKEEETW